MDLIEAIPLVGPTLAVVLPFLVVLAVVVFVHEYGHYIVGRWCGIHAEVFSIGFGKPLLRWTDRRGTRWQVAALPLGGFVRFVGDMDPASVGQVEDDRLTPAQRAVAFHTAPLWARASAVVAGPVANFVLSILIFAALALALGRESDQPVIAEVELADTGFVAGDRVLALGGERVEGFSDIIGILHRSEGATLPALVERDGREQQIEVRYTTTTRIDAITPGMSAAQAGILPGDEIVSMNGRPVSSFYGLQLVAAEIAPGTPVVLEVLRDGRPLTFNLTPDVVERPHPVTGERLPQPTLGVRSSSQGGIAAPREGVGPHEAVVYGLSQTWAIVSGTVTYLGDMIFADADTSQLGGPLRIAEISGEKAGEGISSFVWLIAMLSTSIGLLNLFPIPVLDGGHLMFYAIEAVRGRPLSGAWMQVGTMIGLSLVLSLMVFATYNDISRWLAG